MRSSFAELVVESLSVLPDPPWQVQIVVDEGDWYRLVTAREGDVSWRFVRERSVWRLEAAPSWAPEDSFDADLLARHFLGHGFGRPVKNLEQLTRISLDDLVNELRQIRRPVAEAFRKGSAGWPELREALKTVGHRRDFERLGRPLPPGAS